MMKHRVFASVIALTALLAADNSRALLDWEGEALASSLDGSARSFSFLERWPALEPLDSVREALVVERLRLEGRLYWGDSFVFEAAYDGIALLGGEGVEQYTLGSNSFLRVEDLHYVVERGRNYWLGQNLDRLNLSWRMPRSELIVGRQAVSLGTALVFPAADIIAPFAPASLDNEYKYGVDAVRLSLPIGLNHEAELFAVGHGKEMKEGIYLARWHSVLDAFEFGLLAGSSYKEATFALELAGEMGDAGWYADVLCRRGRDRDDVLRATLGWQRQLHPEWHLLGELHYNGAGEKEPEDYFSVADTPEMIHGEIFLLGRYYGAVSLSWQARPLLTPQLLWIQNLADGSALLQPNLAWDFADNAAAGVGAIWGLGAAPELSFDDGDLLSRSEFGAYPDILFAELRLYF